MATSAKRDQVLELSKYKDQAVRVKFQGGRQVCGTLKGYDQLANIVLDDCVESIRDPQDHYKLTDKTRSIGMVVCRGTQVMLISPVEGSMEISNPFVQGGEES